jgi:hypothetical protein
VASEGTPALAIAPATPGSSRSGSRCCRASRRARRSSPRDFEPGRDHLRRAPLPPHALRGQAGRRPQPPDGLHELFSYNLYPGPSAKKGVYGVLLNIGEAQRLDHRALLDRPVTTPYDNDVVIHARGRVGRRQERDARAHPPRGDGRLLLGENTLTASVACLTLPRGCEFSPVTDDMALCPPAHPESSNGAGESGPKKLTLTDAEDAWFVRVNHITVRRRPPPREAVHRPPGVPLLFLNIDAARTRPR